MQMPISKEHARLKKQFEVQSANFAEILIFSDMPFLLKDTLSMHKLINSAIGKRIEREMIEKIGVRPLGYFQRGERHLTSNRPIKPPDDLDELIIMERFKRYNHGIYVW